MVYYVSYSSLSDTDFANGDIYDIPVCLSDTRGDERGSKQKREVQTGWNESTRV